MGSNFAIGNQPPIPPSVNQDLTISAGSASNPASGLSTQKNLAQATNAGTATSNTVATGESAVQGILANLNLTPRNQV